MVMSAGPFAQPPEVTHLGPEPRGEIGHNALNYLFEVALGGATWLNEFHRFNNPHVVKVVTWVKVALYASQLSKR